MVGIKITEVLLRVDAESFEDAIDTVENMYKNEEVVLDYSDFDGEVLIEKLEPQVTSK